MILDIHTHKAAPQPLAVVDISFIRNPKFKAVDGQLYSAGIHPWDTHRDVTSEEWTRLEELLSRPEFVAVGEAGVDLSGRGGMMFRQLNIFKRQIELSESLKKPIIVHCVKAEDVLCGLIRDLKPTQPWIIHGFRKKPQAAQQLLNAGCYISLGQHFNPDTLHAIPQGRMLAETDESELSIQEIIGIQSNILGIDLEPVIAANSAKVLGL